LNETADFATLDTGKLRVEIDKHTARVSFLDANGRQVLAEKQNGRTLESVTANGEEMEARGFLYKPNLDERLRDWIGYPYGFYDSFHPEARKLFWSQIDMGLFRKGVDAWWMDASEPDLLALAANVGGAASASEPDCDGHGCGSIERIYADEQ
jgi:alpha-glucosidase (family GH31 glycosyl hydrolase)